MTKKREYLAKNIRQGLKLKDALESFKALNNGTLPESFTVEIDTFQHGHDVNGNGTAHYKVTIRASGWQSLKIVESGARREQVGYSGRNEAALYALDKLGYKLDLSKSSSYDYQNCVEYPLILT